MPRYHNINGTNVQFTAAEETARDADEAQVVIDIQEEADEKVAAKVAQDAVDAQKATDKASGNQKLLDLGLTQAEVDALTGQ